jgi:hypothetical protein
VENAVKHNVILREKPLHISVETIPGGQLMVRNSLQLKTVHVSSNKVGLRNISDKYKLMSQPISWWRKRIFFFCDHPAYQAA